MYNITLPILGTRLKQIREHIGYSQAQLAEQLNCKQNAISNLELGKGGSLKLLFQVLNFYSNYVFIDLIFKLIIISVSLVLIYFCMGYILLSTVKIHKFIYGVENVNLKIDLLLSYFIISTYFTVLLIFPQQFKSCYKIGLLGVSICYILNIKILVALMNDPYKIKSKSQDKTNFSRVIIASILIVVLIILNLYLAVCFVSDTGKEAFSNSPNYFDLFYYTIITFTTVGYGDIVPITMEAKIVSSLISITNIICITIFLSTILSYRDKIKSDI